MSSSTGRSTQQRRCRNHGFLPAFFGNHLAVSACGGYSEVVLRKCPGFHAATGLEIGSHDGVDFLPLLAESCPPEAKHKNTPTK